jgi:hypothetical protein
MKTLKSSLAIMLVWALLGGLAGCAATNQDGATGPELRHAQALATAQQWAALASQADAEGLEGLLTANYLHIHATALVETKAQFLDAFRSGARRYDPIVIEEEGVRTWGGCAVVTGKFNLKAVSRGRTIEGVNRFSMVIVLGPSGARVASFQATGIPQPK